MGFTVLLIGIAMIFLPGPALIVIPAGLLILASEFLWAKRLLDKINEFDKPVAHAPSAKGECGACHNPHAADQPFELRTPERILCYSCHGQASKTHEKTYLHSAIKESDCTGCHDAHGSEHKSVLKEVGAKLCYSCHDQDGFIGKSAPHVCAGRFFLYCSTCDALARITTIAVSFLPSAFVTLADARSITRSP